MAHDFEIELNVEENIDKQFIDELVDELNYYTDLYDQGCAEISDEEWDNKYFFLLDCEATLGYINPKSPTIKVHWTPSDKLEKVKHNHPMLSLAKTKNINDLESWFDSNTSLIAMAKADGLTCSIKYEKGKLVSAETRGNGEVGEDITKNIFMVKDVPSILEEPVDIVVDGEIVCMIPDFEKYGEGYKNPRNFAAGAIRRLDPKECRNAQLSFVAWDVITGMNYDFLTNKLDRLQELGFYTIPARIITNNHYDISETIKMIKERSDQEGLPIDGVVFKYDKIATYELKGRNAHHFNGGIAFKFYDEEYETELLDIEWSMSRIGTLTPVAIFKPIDIDGSTVSRANLSNVSVMWDTLGKYPESHQKIYVSKRNQIIPKIERAEKNDIPHDHMLPNGQVPLYCPVCGGEVKVISDFDSITAICTESSCPGKLVNIIDHYCDRAKGLDIRGLSKKTIEQLIEWGWVESPYDLYFLKGHRDEWINKPGFGVTSVTKILDAIEKSKICRLENYISALGIPLIGLTIAKEIVKYYETWNDFRKAIGGRWSDLYGFGIGIENSLNKYDYAMADRIAEMLNFIIPEEDNKEQTVEGMNFCITGKLSKKRDDIKADIEACGGKVTSSVSSKTNYLVCNDKNSTTGKSAEAKRLNIPVITEEELNKLLGVLT